MSSCDLCAAPLANVHSHLVHVADGRLVCACAACALLLGYGSGERYRVVPDRVRPLADARMTDAQWEALGVPVDLAFFHRSTPRGKPVAFYPSPLGATECLLPLDAWAELAAANPGLDTMEPDVEALLVNRTRGRREAYIVPIDACYQLVGLVRLRWRGFTGGDVWEAVDRFFDELRSRGEVAA
ncbi:MAG TPA: DUF5947 family protein [Gemmatimonadales bacterium]|nr:DUF5947 family protein [Gemmatimonadales bacterium]